MKSIEQIKEELGLGYTEIAEFFGYKNAHSFRTAKRRSKIEAGIVSIYSRIENNKPT